MSTQTATATIPTVESPFRLIGGYGDFRDDLISHGYVVIKNAIEPEKARYYQQKAFEWLTSFGTDLDLKKPSTWIAANLPVQNIRLNTFENYAVVHEKFMWDARLEPGVVDAFAKVWGTDELLVSFDSINITLPNRIDKPVRAPWPHTDQAPRKRGMHCVQGIINLSHAGPEDGSLVVIPGSHAILEEFYDTQTDPASWPTRDVRYFSEEEMKWFADRGCTPKKVPAEPGDLILWDSRTIHWGGEPTEKSDTIRTVIYAAYAPAKMASKDALEEKQRVFRANGATTHWPHDNIRLRDVQACFPDGTQDPRDRSEPLEKAEQTDRLLRLAGVKAY
ncbi:hypothetical protein NA57DRAFT_66520 [Rhizodiscina lignyota]|uniref:Phytanoyl-CoA dioxygenase n=1 Tax=Rhizodiscina lignyota TaxID=1504668 RepID=A0A9P4IA52_9PEZI|nr:hypothetical protein NA57DRAFT_66520 [Rhizodiscina lignyota]